MLSLNDKRLAILFSIIIMCVFLDITNDYELPCLDHLFKVTTTNRCATLEQLLNVLTRFKH